MARFHGNRHRRASAPGPERHQVPTNVASTPTVAGAARRDTRRPRDTRTRGRGDRAHLDRRAGRRPADAPPAASDPSRLRPSLARSRQVAGETRCAPTRRRASPPCAPGAALGLRRGRTSRAVLPADRSSVRVNRRPSRSLNVDDSGAPSPGHVIGLAVVHRMREASLAGRDLLAYAGPRGATRRRPVSSRAPSPDRGWFLLQPRSHASANSPARHSAGVSPA